MISGTFHHSKIKEIFADGFYYYGYKEKLEYINFRDCRMHWVKFVNESPEFEETDLQDTDTKVVGWRDESQVPLYIEFFGEPRIKFVFTERRTFWEWMLGKHSQKAIRRYIQVIEELAKHNWTTYDKNINKKSKSLLQEVREGIIGGL